MKGSNPYANNYPKSPTHLQVKSNIYFCDDTNPPLLKDLRKGLFSFDINTYIMNVSLAQSHEVSRQIRSDILCGPTCVQDFI